MTKNSNLCFRFLNMEQKIDQKNFENKMTKIRKSWGNCKGCKTKKCLMCPNCIYPKKKKKCIQRMCQNTIEKNRENKMTKMKRPCGNCKGCKTEKCLVCQNCIYPKKKKVHTKNVPKYN